MAAPVLDLSANLQAAAPPYFNLTGPGAVQAKEKDAAVKRLKAFRTQPESPEYKELLEAFKASPATGCATVLDQIRRRIGYRPADPNPNKVAYFYAMICQEPLFLERKFDGFSFDMKVGTGESGSDPEALLKRFIGTDEIASRRIEEQFRAVILAAINNPGKPQEEILLQEHSLGVREQVSFLYVHSSVKANLNRLPPYLVIGQIAGGRSGFEFGFNAQAWPARAESVLQQDLTTLDNWIDGL